MFKWKDKFSCKINSIDEQHKKLFEIGARLYDLASLKSDADHYDEIKSILNELMDYTEYHFSYEEELMVKEGYPDFDVHKMEHDFFIKKLRKLEGLDLEKNQQEGILKVVSFVADWIAAHILQTDAGYVPYLTGKGIS